MIDFVINGQVWQVELTSPYHPILLRADGSFTLGCCDNTTKTIYIASNLDKKKFKKVLAHEITHAAMFSYKVNLTIDQEELLADIISTYGGEIVYITNKVFKKIKMGR